ncbi:hypothetical protein C623_0235340 [Bacillus thuringiensis serovar aizawai str. Hu4-2]|jgi:hypothetical protein|nr:hypothetical protein C623_0235340 [Bacillus thuringiensis serovar aizawai str. Hu4-2]
MQAFNAMFELSSAICLSVFLFIVLPCMWLKRKWN